jgi:hypothetical protein
MNYVRSKLSAHLSKQNKFNINKLLIWIEIQTDGYMNFSQVVIAIPNRLSLQLKSNKNTD